MLRTLQSVVRTINLALQKPNNDVRVVLLCGDGSIMKTLQKMNERHNVDISKLRVAVLPFGTGND